MKNAAEKYRYYDGMNVKNFEYLTRISTYNHNYYVGSGKDLLYGKSDDDMTTEWFIIRGDNPPLYIGYSMIEPGSPERFCFSAEYPT